MWTIECHRGNQTFIHGLPAANHVFAPASAGTLPMDVSLGSVQLRCEAAAARRWSGSRAAYLSASVTASRPSHFATRYKQLIRRNGRAASASARGTGRAAYTATRSADP